MGEHPEDWNDGATYGVRRHADHRAAAPPADQRRVQGRRRPSHVRPVIVTGWTLVALNRKPFGSGTESKVFPKNPGTAHKAFKFRPSFNSISPKNGAKYTNTRVVAHPRHVHRLLSQGHRHQAPRRPGSTWTTSTSRGRPSSATTGCTCTLKNVAERRPQVHASSSATTPATQGHRAQVHGQRWPRPRRTRRSAHHPADHRPTDLPDRVSHAHRPAHVHTHTDATRTTYADAHAVPLQPQSVADGEPHRQRLADPVAEHLGESRRRGRQRRRR